MANVLINQGTQSQIRTDTAGTVEVGVVKVDMSTAGTYGVSMFEGTILRVHTIGTIPNIPGGTITNVGTVIGIGSLSNVAQVHNAGTIQALPNTPGGTLGLVTRVGNIGTLEVGTISALPNIPGGTLGVVTSVTNLANGTLAAVTSITNLAAGTVTRLVDGTVRIPAGTITSLSAGTITRLEGGTLGVVSAVTNLVGGTVTRVEQGSIQVTAGTMRLNPNPTQVTQSFGTTTTGTIGTLVAAPSAGSAIYITNLTISVQSGTVEPVVSFNLAANGNGVVNRGLYVAGGGAVIPFPVPNSANNTGTALTWNILSGSGTVSYNVSYFIAIP